MATTGAGMDVILSDLTTFADSALGTVGTVVNTITSNPLLLIGVLGGLLAFGIGLVRKLM